MYHIHFFIDTPHSMIYYKITDRIITEGRKTEADFKEEVEDA